MPKTIQYYHQGKCKLSLVIKTRKQTSKNKSSFWCDNHENFLPVSPSALQMFRTLPLSVVLWNCTSIEMTLIVLFEEVCVKKNWLGLYMLWFKFILGLKVFELVSILFAIVPDYGNEYTTKENKNWTSFRNFPPKLNLNHNINFVRLFFPYQN